MSIFTPNEICHYLRDKSEDEKDAFLGWLASRMGITSGYTNFPLGNLITMLFEDFQQAQHDAQVIADFAADKGVGEDPGSHHARAGHSANWGFGGTGW